MLLRVPVYSSTSLDATFVFGLVHFTVLKSGRDTESLVDFPVNCASVTAYVLRRPNIHLEARSSLALDRCGTDCAWRIDGDYQLIVCVGQRLADVHRYRQVVFPFPVAGCVAEIL